MADLSALQRPASIAFYLPQFHPIPENDQAWGPGFTEWHSVVRARPVFRGHRQPNLPGELGFYDLRLDATREAQAALAEQFGVDAFCYYHYWFSGRRLLGGPLDAVLSSDRPRLPFCLCWANEPWRANWDGRSGATLVEAVHSDADDRDHIRWLLPVLEDDRYIRLDGKPLLLVYRAHLLPSPSRTMLTWREEAARAGVGELLLCRVESFNDERDDPRLLGFDASVEFQPDWGALPDRLSLLGPHRAYDYRALAEQALAKPRPPWPRFRCVTPRWDNTPRMRPGVLFTGSTPERYRAWLASVADEASAGEPIFVNAWNEWGEGAYLEPDRDLGRAYLQAHHEGMTHAARYAGPLPAAPGPPSALVRLLARRSR